MLTEDPQSRRPGQRQSHTRASHRGGGASLAWAVRWTDPAPASDRGVPLANNPGPPARERGLGSVAVLHEVCPRMAGIRTTQGFAEQHVSGTLSTTISSHVSRESRLSLERNQTDRRVSGRQRRLVVRLVYHPNNGFFRFSPRIQAHLPILTSLAITASLQLSATEISDF